MKWQKGQSGNPKGRKVAGESITEQIRLLSRTASGKRGFSRAQAIADVILRHAEAGDSWACAMALERLDGKVKDTLELQDRRPIISVTTNAPAPVEVLDTETRTEDEHPSVTH